MMHEEWLQRLANDIREKEHKAAEEAARARVRIQLLTAKGPVFWKAFADSLHENVLALRNLLEGDVTLTEGPLSFTFDPVTQQVQLAKAAFPAVQLAAVPHFEEETAEITYRSPGSGGEPASMACRFGFTPDTRLMMHLDGRAFGSPAEAATFITDRLFRLATGSRREAQDSHLGRVGSE